MSVRPPPTPPPPRSRARNTEDTPAVPPSPSSGCLRSFIIHPGPGTNFTRHPCFIRSGYIPLLWPGMTPLAPGPLPSSRVFPPITLPHVASGTTPPWQLHLNTIMVTSITVPHGSPTTTQSRWHPVPFHPHTRPLSTGASVPPFSVPAPAATPSSQPAQCEPGFPFSPSSPRPVPSRCTRSRPTTTGECPAVTASQFHHTHPPTLTPPGASWEP